MESPPPPPPPTSIPPPPPRPVPPTRMGRRVPVLAIAVAISLAAIGAYAAVLWSADPIGGASWGLRMVQALDLQGLGYTGEGVAVCLVDTGVDLSHPDLSGVHLAGWRDLINGRSAPYDDDGHGTAMAGLIVANGPSFRGAAPGASLLAAKALDDAGMGTSSTVAGAIRFCIDPNADGSTADGAEVISLSLSAERTPISGTEIDLAVEAALSAGVFVVAAAGNDGGPGDDGDVQRPSSISLVIAVGAVDGTRFIAPYSSVGSNAFRSDPNKKPEVVAPGDGLVTIARGGGYQVLSGTSASAALTAGLLALVLQAQPGYAKSGYAAITNLKTALMATAEPGPGQDRPHDDRYGYGIVQGYALVRAL